MTSNSSSARGSELHDRMRASSEVAADLRRFGQVCGYGLPIWLAFGAITMVLATQVYAVAPLRFVVTRGLGVAVILVAVGLGRRPPAFGARGVSVLTLAVAATIAGIIGYEASFLGGAASPYVLGAAFPLVGLGTLQRRARDAWPPLVATGLAYGVGVGLSPAVAFGDLPLAAVAAFGTQLALIVALALFCLLLSHYAWTMRRQLFESRSIGRYRLQRRLGRGGMGEVWAAFHTTLGRDVAVKILRPERVDDAAVQRFEREVRATTSLTHPNTVRVFDYGVTEDGLWYYAMELLDGASFAQLLDTAGAQPAGRAVYLVAQAARALGEAHRAGIVHRDVKPENLVICQAGGEPDFVKVIDFGIARTLGDANMTAVGEVAGTPSYMAPETAAGQGADARSDVYALGAVLYALLTGRAPFEAEDPRAMARAHRDEPVVPPSLRVAGPVAADVEGVVLTCLAKAPAARYADGAELADALAETAAFTAWRPGTAPSRPALIAEPVDSETPTVVSRES